MIGSKVLLLSLLIVIGGLCTLGIKDNVYNVTEDNFEEFVELAKSKNATFTIKFFTRTVFLT